MGKSSRLRFSSESALPQRMRDMLQAQGKGGSREVSSKAVPPVSKYRNEPTTVDGIRFDSKREARYYEQLKIRKAAGEVDYWLRQVPVHLPGGTKYVVDFLVFFIDPDRAPEYVDVKGRETPVFRLKKREVEHHYPFRIVLV